MRMGRVTALRIPCGLGRALGRDTDEYLIDEICCVSTRKQAHCIAGESYKVGSAPSVGSKGYLAIFRAPYLYCHPRLLISFTTPHCCLSISRFTSTSTANIDQRPHHNGNGPSILHLLRQWQQAQCQHKTKHQQRNLLSHVSIVPPRPVQRHPTLPSPSTSRLRPSSLQGRSAEKHAMPKGRLKSNRFSSDSPTRQHT